MSRKKDHPQEHVYSKVDLITRFEGIKGSTLLEIDDLGILQNAREYNLQKGIAGTIIEQCVLRYSPDSEQRPDLLVVDGNKKIPTELKTTGLRQNEKGNSKRYVAKEPMSITAVGIYDIGEQSFEESHFWGKIENLLIVYYHYLSNHSVSASEYGPFPIIDYEFHEFTKDEIATLKQDWLIVRDFCESIVSQFPGPKDAAWKRKVKEEYIDRHDELRKVLSYIELVPKFPPRFRLKKPVVNSIVDKHFKYKVEKLPGKYITVQDIDKKCDELTAKYGGGKYSIGDLADKWGVPRLTKEGSENKGITEQIVVKMFGGESKKLNKIDLFRKYGLIAKSIAVTPNGGRTEDMKLYHIDFSEMTKTEIIEDDGTIREYTFEDSELYEYFAGNELLCIIFEEPPKEYRINPKTNKREEVVHPLAMNKFLGFRRMVFSEKFIETYVKACWEDTREKILNNYLENVVAINKDGQPQYNKSGGVKAAPSFMKASQNPVFIRGSGTNSADENKTECVNGIKMLPQYIWIKGKSVVDELGQIKNNETSEET